MPKPKKKEDKKSYMARFMSSGEAIADYPDEKQRYKVALSMWEDKGMKKSVKLVLKARIIKAGMFVVSDRRSFIKARPTKYIRKIGTGKKARYVYKEEGKPRRDIAQLKQQLVEVKDDVENYKVKVGLGLPISYTGRSGGRGEFRSKLVTAQKKVKQLEEAIQIAEKEKKRMKL